MQLIDWNETDPTSRLLQRKLFAAVQSSGEDGRLAGQKPSGSACPGRRVSF